MKFIKRFGELNESRDHSDFLEKFVDKLPGENTYYGGLNIDSKFPSANFGIDVEKFSRWRTTGGGWAVVCDTMDTEKAVEFIEKTIDPDLFEDERIRKQIIENDTAYKLNLRKCKNFLGDAIKFANTYGLAIKVCIILVKPLSDYHTFREPQAFLTFCESDTMKEKYKG